MPVRLIALFMALAVVGGLVGLPAVAAQYATTKNFVPAPNTPSYFIDESGPFGGKSPPQAVTPPAASRSVAVNGTSSAATPRTKPAAGKIADRRTAAARRAAERRAALASIAQARQRNARLLALQQQQQLRQEAERRLALARKAKAELEARQRLALAQQKKAALDAAQQRQTAARPAVPASPHRAPGTVRSALSERSGGAGLAGILGGAAIIVVLLALAWFWRRGRQSALPPAAVAEPRSARVAEAAPTDLNAVLRRLEPAIRRRLPRRTDFQFSLLPELRPGRTDETAVSAAIVALAAAGAADLPRGGKIVVGTRNYPVDADLAAEHAGAIAGDYVRLTVRDYGPGLSERAYAQIFDPAETVRPAIAIAAETVRRQGGFVRVETAEGVGTAVHLFFRPARAEPAAEQADDAEQVRAAE